MKLTSFAAVALLALSLTACEAAEEPDSFSEQGSSTEQVTESAAKGSEEKADKKSATPKWKRNMNKVKLGMSMKRVKKLLGKPDDTNASETTVPEMDEDTYEMTERTMTMDTWTYGNIITDDATWVLSFTDGKLESKSRV